MGSYTGAWLLCDALLRLWIDSFVPSEEKRGRDVQLQGVEGREGNEAGETKDASDWWAERDLQLVCSRSDIGWPAN